MLDTAPRSTPHLDAYFARIRYAGPRDPTLATLRGIVFQHVTNIPFENINVLLGLGISLDPRTVEQKLVHDRRGGYCFEQNGLLLRVLTALGFTAEPLSARVRLQQPRDFTPPRTHLFLKVTINGVPWLADTGVGGFSPTAPLRIDTEAAQETHHGAHRVVHEDGVFFHQAMTKDGWSDVYEFTGECMPEIDRTLANWWTSTSPESKFRNSLLVALALPDGTRAGIMNRSLVRRRAGDIVEASDIGSPQELLTLLDQTFGLRFAAGTRLDGPQCEWRW